MKGFTQRKNIKVREKTPKSLSLFTGTTNILPLSATWPASGIKGNIVRDATPATTTNTIAN
jgi:hypothetical protein